MRFKIFLYHFLVVLGCLILMGAWGYTGLKSIIDNQVITGVQKTAGLLVAELNRPGSQGREQEILESKGASFEKYSWIVDSRGNILNYPDFRSPAASSWRSADEKEISPVVCKPEKPAFTWGNGIQRRMIYSEQLNNGNFVVVSSSMETADSILLAYNTTTIYAGIAITMGAIILLLFLSKESLKPLSDLQVYAKNLAVGEYIDRADSLKEPDVVAVASILERFYNQTAKVRSLDQNPMSGLPGNKSLYDALFQLIESGKLFAVGFVDIDGFSAYNEKFGITKGDSVIRFVGVSILNSIKEQGNKDDRIFHLGGDRFFFVTTPDRVEGICNKIIEDYEKQILKYYISEEGESEGRVEEDQMVIPVCIGVATNSKRPLIHPLQIGHIVGGIRNYLRGSGKSAYLVDRRITGREDELRGEKAPFPRDEVDEIRKMIEKSEIQESDDEEKVSSEEAGIDESTKNGGPEGDDTGNGINHNNQDQDSGGNTKQES